jgi:hypothetical protein
MMRRIWEMTMAEQWVMKIVLDAPTDKVEFMMDIIADRVTTTYLLGFWPDRFGGRGEVTLTDDLDAARKFASFQDVMECWKTQSKVVPLRDDGKPNRPLTAFTVQPHKIAD